MACHDRSRRVCGLLARRVLHRQTLEMNGCYSAYHGSYETPTGAAEDKVDGVICTIPCDLAIM